MNSKWSWRRWYIVDEFGDLLRTKYTSVVELKKFREMFVSWILINGQSWQTQRAETLLAFYKKSMKVGSGSVWVLRDRHCSSYSTNIWHGICTCTLCVLDSWAEWTCISKFLESNLYFLFFFSFAAWILTVFTKLSPPCVSVITVGIMSIRISPPCVAVWIFVVEILLIRYWNASCWLSTRYA